MDDEQIIGLFLSRSESALSETAKKYGKYCSYIAFSVLRSNEDAEECVQDAYMKLWNSIPPQMPQNLRAFVGRLTRNTALNRYEHDTAAKRGGSATALVLDELEECIAWGKTADSEIDSLALTEILNRFLAGMKKEPRRIFVLRYWYFLTVKEIADRLGIGVGKVKMSLLRSRNELKELLRKEDFAL